MALASLPAMIRGPYLGRDFYSVPGMPIRFTSLDLTNPGRWAGIIKSILWMRHQVPTGEGSCLKARIRTQVFTIPISGPEVIFGGTVRSFEISLDKGVEDYLCWMMSQVICYLFSLTTGEIFSLE